jgi:hypothetical protein
MVRWLLALVIAVVVMLVLGTAAHSFMVQEAWSAAVQQGEGAAPALALADRISWFTHDLVGMAPLFGALAAIALFVAFLAGTLVARFTGLRPVVFAVAGAVAIFVLFTALKWQLGTVGVFGARGMTGLGLQMAAGLIAGLVFAALTRPREA